MKRGSSERSRSRRITSPSRGYSRKIAWTVVALICAVVLGFGGWKSWRWATLTGRLQAALPAIPELNGRPAILQKRLSAAQALVSQRKTVIEGVAELGRLYHANSFWAEAETCWRALLRDQPDEPRWSYYLADLRRLASDYDEVLSLLVRTTELSPEYVPALLQIADIKFKQGKLDLAGQYYRERLRLLPKDPYAGLGLARIALAQKQPDEAGRLLAKICEDVPNFPSSHNLYAEILAAKEDEKAADRHRWLGREAGRFREAEDPWLNELQSWCFEPRQLRVLATIAYQTGETERGLSLLLRSIDLDPENREGLETLGDLHIKLNKPDLAVDALTRSFGVNDPAKSSPRAYMNLSHAYRMLKQPERALVACEQGIDRLGPTFEIYDAKGVALAELGRREESVRAFEAALALRPNDANTNFNLALNLLALNRVDEAYARLKQSLTLEPTFAKSLTLLTEMEMDAGRTSVAEEYARRLYEAQPGMPRAQQLLGLLHLRAGKAAQANDRVKDAENHYRNGIEVDPEGADLHASLGVLMLVQQRFGEALPPLETYRRLQPEQAQSSLFLGQVYASVGRIPEARQVLVEGRKIAERTGNARTAENCRAMLEQLGGLAP